MVPHKGGLVQGGLRALGLSSLSKEGFKAHGLPHPGRARQRPTMHTVRWPGAHAFLNAARGPSESPHAEEWRMGPSIVVPAGGPLTPAVLHAAPSPPSHPRTGKAPTHTAHRVAGRVALSVWQVESPSVCVTPKYFNKINSVRYKHHQSTLCQQCSNVWIIHFPWPFLPISTT